MIMSVAELRQIINTDESDSVLAVHLQALESLIRSYTNNNFNVRNVRTVAQASSTNNTIICSKIIPVKIGDTIQITASAIQEDVLLTVESVNGSTIGVDADVYDEESIVITKVVYPMDVKLGVAKMLQYQLEYGNKAGIQSETISRHSVTYFNQDSDNTVMGFPKAMLGFLKPYMKARFGQGIRV